MAENNRAKLMKQLQTAHFAVEDITLYLDTHPNDANALAYYEQAKRYCIQVQKEYTAQYGPITADAVTVTNSWTWVNNPWPWEREA